MFRVLVGMAVLVFLVAPVVGCGGGGDDASDDQKVSTTTSRPQPQKKSSGARIEDKAEPLDVIEGFEIKPYFDAYASSTERAVSPGDGFELYVFLGYPDPYHVNALEYRLEMPAGVNIVAESKFDSHALTIGNPMEDFSMAYQCMPPGKFFVMKYECQAGPDFTGGEFRTTPGVNKYGKLFLGVVTCQGEAEKIPAQGGTAVLNLE